jgi:hypothetical protein
MDNPELPRPEDLPPERARFVQKPSEFIPESVTRMHNATIELLRAQLASGPKIPGLIKSVHGHTLRYFHC